jgi:hypothetical protein
MKVNEPDSISVACVGGFLIAAAVGSIFSLRSGSWKETRITTYYLMTWSVLNGLRLALHIVTNKDFALVPNCVCTLIIGIGLACVVCNRIAQSKNKLSEGHKDTMNTRGRFLCVDAEEPFPCVRPFVFV